MIRMVQADASIRAAILPLCIKWYITTAMRAISAVNLTSIPMAHVTPILMTSKALLHFEPASMYSRYKSTISTGKTMESTSV